MVLLLLLLIAKSKCANSESKSNKKADRGDSSLREVSRKCGHTRRDGHGDSSPLVVSVTAATHDDCKTLGYGDKRNCFIKVCEEGEEEDGVDETDVGEEG